MWPLVLVVEKSYLQTLPQNEKEEKMKFDPQLERNIASFLKILNTSISELHGVYQDFCGQLMNIDFVVIELPNPQLKIFGIPVIINPKIKKPRAVKYTQLEYKILEKNRKDSNANTNP